MNRFVNIQAVLRGKSFLTNSTGVGFDFDVVRVDVNGDFTLRGELLIAVLARERFLARVGADVPDEVLIGADADAAVATFEFPIHVAEVRAEVLHERMSVVEIIVADVAFVFLQV